MFSRDPYAIDQQLGPHPRANSRQPADPCWQRAQAAPERPGVAEVPLDRRPCLVQRLAKIALQDRYTPQPVQTLVVLAAARIFGGAVRRHELVTPGVGRVVDVADIVVAVAQQVAAV